MMFGQRTSSTGNYCLAGQTGSTSQERFLAWSVDAGLALGGVNQLSLLKFGSDFCG